MTMKKSKAIAVIVLVLSACATSKGGPVLTPENSGPKPQTCDVADECCDIDGETWCCFDNGARIMCCKDQHCPLGNVE